MLKISKAVANILAANPEIQQALKQDYLNLTGYARIIKPAVERVTKKPVKVGTIVVALSRMADKLDTQLSTSTDETIQVRGITVKSELMEITFERTSATFQKFRDFRQELTMEVDDFFLLTHGVSEITVIFSKSLEQEIFNFFAQEEPKYIIRDLVAVTVKLTKEHQHQRNVFYNLLKTMSLNEINIIEIVSTFTELTFILKQQDMGQAVETLSEYYAN